VLCAGRAAGKQLSHASRKSLDVLSVEVRAPLGLALAVACTCVTIGQALRFGSHQSRFLDQYALSFVSVSCTAPLEDDGRQRRVLACATRQGGIPRREEDEVIQVGAGQA
jgi:hypothetical protein